MEIKDKHKFWLANIVASNNVSEPAPQNRLVGEWVEVVFEISPNDVAYITMPKEAAETLKTYLGEGQ